MYFESTGSGEYTWEAMMSMGYWNLFISTHKTTLYMIIYHVYIPACKCVFNDA
jgi:hypothetical protein